MWIIFWVLFFLCHVEISCQDIFLYLDIAHYLLIFKIFNLLSHLQLACLSNAAKFSVGVEWALYYYLWTSSFLLSNMWYHHTSNISASGLCVTNTCMWEDTRCLKFSTLKSKSHKILWQTLCIKMLDLQKRGLKGKQTLFKLWVDLLSIYSAYIHTDCWWFLLWLNTWTCPYFSSGLVNNFFLCVCFTN